MTQFPVKVRFPGESDLIDLAISARIINPKDKKVDILFLVPDDQGREQERDLLIIPLHILALAASRIIRAAQSMKIEQGSFHSRPFENPECDIVVDREINGHGQKFITMTINHKIHGPFEIYLPLAIAEEAGNFFSRTTANASYATAGAGNETVFTPPQPAASNPLKIGIHPVDP